MFQQFNEGNCAGLAIESLRVNAFPRRLSVPLSKVLKRHARNRVPSGGVVRHPLV